MTDKGKKPRTGMTGKQVEQHEILFDDKLRAHVMDKKNWKEIEVEGKPWHSIGLSIDDLKRWMDDGCGDKPGRPPKLQPFVMDARRGCLLLAKKD